MISLKNLKAELYGENFGVMAGFAPSGVWIRHWKPARHISHIDRKCESDNSATVQSAYSSWRIEDAISWISSGLLRQTYKVRQGAPELAVDYGDRCIDWYI